MISIVNTECHVPKTFSDLAKIAAWGRLGQVAGQAGAAMTFSASAKDGRKPGVILPGGVALATGELSRLAIGGGLGLLMESRSGLDRGAKRSAAAIIKQTRLLYRASGWIWPPDQNGTRHNAPRKATS